MSVDKSHVYTLQIQIPETSDTKDKDAVRRCLLAAVKKLYNRGYCPHYSKDRKSVV